MPARSIRMMTMNRNTSCRTAKSNYSTCSDHSPMLRKPRRRPSLDNSTSSSTGKDSFALDADHSEATHVTSNQHHGNQTAAAAAEEEEEERQEAPVPVHTIKKMTKSKKSGSVTSLRSLPTTQSNRRSNTTKKKSVSFHRHLDPKNKLISLTGPDDDDEHLGEISLVMNPTRTAEALVDNKDDSQTRKNSGPPPLTEERVRSFLVDYYEDFDSIFQLNPPDSTTSSTRKECMTAFCDQYFTKDFIFIRPSGNPLDQHGFAVLMAEKIVVQSMTLVSIDHIQLLTGAMSAVVTFTADQVFTFKDQLQQDRTIVTAVLVTCETERGIQIAHKHRSPGVPIPKTTRWDEHK